MLAQIWPTFLTAYKQANELLANLFTIQALFCMFFNRYEFADNDTQRSSSSFRAQTF